MHRVRIANESVVGHAVDARTLVWMAAAAAAGIVGAGFWNVGFVDGLGLATFVTPVIGPFEGKGLEFASLGGGFGFLFAIVTGLATTVTASNCAAFGMLPALAFSTHGRRGESVRLATIVALSAALMSSAYGVFVGRLGPDGIAAFNAGPIRSAQSLSVFGAIGVVMILWALVEAGFVAVLLPELPIEDWEAAPLVRALISGGLIGAFGIGRPLAVFREFLVYAAQPARVRYGAALLALEALGAVFLPMTAFLLLTWFRGDLLDGIKRRTPQLAARVSAAALTGFGTFLIFYWGVTRIWPMFGRWGFKLGWFS